MQAGAADFSGGSALVLHGTAGAGLTASGSQVWRQGQGVGGADEQGDNLGATLRVAQFGGSSSHGDLALGVPGEALGSVQGAGRVVLLFGSGQGLTTTGQQSWSQASPGIRGGAEPGDGFGRLR